MAFGFFKDQSDWYFRDCFTLDPTKTMAAWERLCVDQAAIEIGMLPKTLHHALLDTLKERKTFEKIR